MIRVRYSKMWGYTILICGLVLLVAHVYLYTLTQHVRPANLVVVFFLITSGILYLTRVFFELHPDKIVVFTLFGLQKTHPVSSFSEIAIDHDKVFVIRNGVKKKIMVGKMMSDKDDWQKFLMKLKEEDLSGELHNI